MTLLKMHWGKFYIFFQAMKIENDEFSQCILKQFDKDTCNVNGKIVVYCKRRDIDWILNRKVKIFYLCFLLLIHEKYIISFKNKT